MKKWVVLDTECFHGYWLLEIKGIESGIVRAYELFDGHPLPCDRIRDVLTNYTTVGFNSNSYDLPMIQLALTGATTAQLKAASDWLIVGEHTAWDFRDHYNLPRPGWDHVDLIEVAPGQASLKLYGGRLHSKRLQDLPYSPDTIIDTPELRESVSSYCENDLDTTIDLYRKLRPQLDLRENMSTAYGLDLRSKSDAQIAEAVIRSEVGKKLQRRVERPEIPPGTTFRYKAPAWMTFTTPALQQKLRDVETSSFITDKNGSPIEPPSLAGAVVKIGCGEYRMGIGGLHSSETRTAHWADDGIELVDADVASYYPSIILRCGLFPTHMGTVFLDVYQSIVDRRLAAKKAKDTVVADALKITINGSFGKLGSMWSALYAPDLMIQTTVTGQLALLMLIERMESTGVQVVSANTDGIVLKFHRDRRPVVNANIKWWEKTTGFVMEQTAYRALLSRDVNNYIALKQGGGSKGKGAFGEVALSKNPQTPICVTAVKQFLDCGVPLAQTILECRDVRQFLVVRTVKGGAVKVTRTNYDDRLTPAKKRDLLLAKGWEVAVPGPVAKMHLSHWGHLEGDVDVDTAYRIECGEDEFYYIGKVVRWYYSTSTSGCFHYMTKNKSGNRNAVPNSEGGRELMELPEVFPSDVNYEWYIDTAKSILSEIGVKL